MSFEIKMLIDDVDALARSLRTPADGLPDPDRVARTAGVDAGVTADFKWMLDQVGRQLSVEVQKLAFQLNQWDGAVRECIKEVRENEVKIAQEINRTVTEVEAGASGVVAMLDSSAEIMTRDDAAAEDASSGEASGEPYAGADATGTGRF